MSYLLHKQTALLSNIKKNPDRYLYCNELHFIICLLLFWFEWYAEQIFMFGMYLVPISIYKFKRQRKLQLNSHRKFVNIHMRNLVKLWKFSLHLSLETVLPALKLTICYINMRVSFLENWQFNHKLAFLKLQLKLQKFQLSNSLVNWEKFGSTA